MSTHEPIEIVTIETRHQQCPVCGDKRYPSVITASREIWATDETDSYIEGWSNKRIERPIFTDAEGNRWNPRYAVDYSSGTTFTSPQVEGLWYRPRGSLWKRADEHPWVTDEMVERAARAMLTTDQLDREGWWMAHHRVTARRALEAALTV